MDRRAGEQSRHEAEGRTSGSPERTPAACAGAALRAYAAAFNAVQATDISDQELGAYLLDLVADLMHWAERAGVSFDAIVGEAGKHFASEIAATQERSREA